MPKHRNPTEVGREGAQTQDQGVTCQSPYNTLLCDNTPKLSLIPTLHEVSHVINTFMTEHAGRRGKGFESTNHLLLMGFLQVPHRAMVRRAFFARKGHARDRPQTECFQVKASGALQGPCQPHACPASLGPIPPWESVGSDLTGLSLGTCSHSQGHHVTTEAFPSGPDSPHGNPA